MDQSYWDLSSILADSVRLPCHFAIDVPGLSHIVGTNQVTTATAAAAVASSSSAAANDDDAKRGVDGANALIVEKKSRVDLPFWMAELLALHNVVDLSFPRQYSARVRSALDAQAKSVRLRDLNGWWYAVGVRLSALIEAKELIEVLAKTYQARILPIYSSSQNLAASSKRAHSEDGGGNEALAMINDDVDSFGANLSISMSLEMQDFIHGLEESESVLLSTGQRSSARMLSYLHNTS
ncbi:hypothetical protein CBS101457_001693 [Exobasidium rhododendri]|nr:hypothetical protein CBS101457_001693 [Exobasidium rhododendri]